MASPTDPDIVQLNFVCLGNICRSPTAEGIMATLVAEAGLSHRIAVDSSGTGAWHAGEPADKRSAREARSRGIELTSRARQFHPGDFYEFDLILAMDESNLSNIIDVAPESALREKAHLLRSFDPNSAGLQAGQLDVPDPYYGGSNGFADVFDLIDAACRGLLADLQTRYRLTP